MPVLSEKGRDLSSLGYRSSKRKPIQLTLSTEDSEAILNAAGIRLPDAADAEGAGTEVKWFAHYDVFQNYSDEEMVNTGACTFIEKYDGSFKWVETTWDGRYNDLANLLLSSDQPDMFPGETGIFPANVIKGMFQPVNDYIDYDDPLWSGIKDYAYTYFNLNGNIYAAVINADFGTILPYNRRVMEEYGYNDPAELFYNNEWTWDKFYDMCMDFSDPDADRYGIDGWFWSESLMYASGKTVVALDTDTCQFYSNVDDPGLERAGGYVYELNRNECVYPHWNQPSWHTRNDNLEGAGVKEGLTLFWPAGTWALGNTVAETEAVWGDLHAEEVMIVPMPRDPNGDGNYYIESTPNAYALINGAKNPEGAALVCACERFKTMDPVVRAIDRRQMKETLLWSDEMLDMQDICCELANGGNPIVAYNNGMGDSLDSVNSSFMDFGVNPNAQSWAQLKAANADRMQYLIDEFNAEIRDFIERGGTFEADDAV